MASGYITCIGSLIVEHIMITDRLPNRGETFTANSYRQAFGGKGANSAIATFRSSHNKPKTQGGLAASCYGEDFDIIVHFIGAVGNDDPGALYKKYLQENGIDISGLRFIDGMSTGTGFAIVDEDTRDNWLLGVLGANESFKAADFVRVDSLGSGMVPDLIVAQLKIDLGAIEQMLETAGQAGIDVLLNPSPAKHILSKYNKWITHFIVNESEAAIYSGLDVEDVIEENWESIAQGFLVDGFKNVVITLGAAGAFYANAKTSGHVKAYKVSPVDVTGAGDTFTGAYASEYVRQKKLQELWDIEKAVIRACKASALTICTLGAQEGIPWADEVDSFFVDRELGPSLDEPMASQDASVKL